MKKITVTLTQELTLPDSCQIVDGIDGPLITLNGKRYLPRIDWMEGELVGAKEARFVEVSEDSYDVLFGAVSSEKREIK